MQLISGMQIVNLLELKVAKILVPEEEVLMITNQQKITEGSLIIK